MDMKRGGKTCCDPLYFIEHFVTFWACSSLLIKPPTPSLHVEYRLHVQTGGSLLVQAFAVPFYFSGIAPGTIADWFRAASAAVLV